MSASPSRRLLGWFGETFGETPRRLSDRCRSLVWLLELPAIPALVVDRAIVVTLSFPAMPSQIAAQLLGHAAEFMPEFRRRLTARASRRRVRRFAGTPRSAARGAA